MKGGEIVGQRQNPVLEIMGSKLEEYVINVPDGAVSPEFAFPMPCKVWAIRGQVEAGPGTTKTLLLKRADGETVCTLDFDTDTDAVPLGEVVRAKQALDKNEKIIITKGDDTQAGWVTVSVGR